MKHCLKLVLIAVFPIFVIGCSGEKKDSDAQNQIEKPRVKLSESRVQDVDQIEEYTAIVESDVKNKTEIKKVTALNDAVARYFDDREFKTYLTGFLETLKVSKGEKDVMRYISEAIISHHEKYMEGFTRNLYIDSNNKFEDNNFSIKVTKTHYYVISPHKISASPTCLIPFLFMGSGMSLSCVQILSAFCCVAHALFMDS